MSDETMTTPVLPTSNRRGFLLGAGTVGIAAAGMATASSAQAVAPATSNTELEAAADAAGPLMMYVKDARRGQIGVLIGDREIVVTDRAAVAGILTAAGR